MWPELAVASHSHWGGGFSVNFRRYARLGNKFLTLCTDNFAWKMYPLYWNVQKTPPKNAPIFMKCTENLAQNSTHLQAICGTNLIQRYTSFLKIYRMLSGKMIPTMIKCTGNNGLWNCMLRFNPKWDMHWLRTKQNRECLLQKRVLKILVSLLVHLNIYQLLCNSSKSTSNYPLLPHERNVCIMSSWT